MYHEGVLQRALMAIFFPEVYTRHTQQWAARRALTSVSNPRKQSRYLGQAVAASVLINSSTDVNTGLDDDPFDNIWDL